MSEKLDVVYTLAHKSKHRDDWELRYSLRSISGQPWLGEVYLIGHKPAWARNVHHIACADPLGNKDANIIRKVLLACHHPDISERFVVNSDDHYILRPLEERGLGPFLENPSQLDESRERYARSTWCRRLVDTVAYCQANELPDWVLECHTPYVVEASKYIKAMERVPWADDNGLVTHIYFNLTLPRRPRRARQNLTTRLKVPIHNPAEVARLMEGRDFFNHNNSGLTPAVQEWLQARFRNPSQFEAPSNGERHER